MFSHDAFTLGTVFVKLFPLTPFHTNSAKFSKNYYISFTKEQNIHIFKSIYATKLHLQLILNFP